MSVIKIKRTIRLAGRKTSADPRSLRGIVREYFARESMAELVGDVVVFAVIAAASAWPITAALVALNEFFHRGGA